LPGRLRLLTLLCWLVGAGLFAWLLMQSDPPAIFRAAGGLGWWLAAILAFQLLPMLMDALGWRLLFAKARPPLRDLLWIRWIGESANGLLPLGHMGEFLRVKLARDRGSSGTEAAASVIVDITVALATQLLFTLVGLLLFSLRRGGDVLARALLASVVLAAFAGIFFALQHFGVIGRAGVFLARRIGRSEQIFDFATAQRLDEAVKRVYARRRLMFQAACWRFAGWVVAAGEIMIVLHAFGHDVSLSASIQMESLSQAARVVAFIIPGGLGVQDGALLLVAAALGVAPDLALALALVRRLRELALGLPGLALAYVIETRGWLRARRTDPGQSFGSTDKEA
jgi:putative membrane protein